MSFNIRFGTAEDGKNAWQYRKDLVIERIRAFQPDLLGLQECRSDFQAEYVKAKLWDYDFIGFERGGDGDAALEMTPLFIRHAAFQISDRGCFWLSETPDVPGSMDWGSALPRIVTWAKLKVTSKSNRQLYFLNTHFDHASKQAQAESAILLRKFIRDLDHDLALILCGDFNTEKDSQPYRTLLAGSPDDPRGFHDPYRDIHPTQSPSAGTFHDFGRLKRQPAIDWILVSDHFKTIGVAIDKHRNGERYPADHYPLLATVKLL